MVDPGLPASFFAFDRGFPGMRVTIRTDQHRPWSLTFRVAAILLFASFFCPQSDGTSKAKVGAGPRPLVGGFPPDRRPVPPRFP